MTASVNNKFDTLVALLKEVKPSLDGTTVKPEDSVVEDLGLDSLDILQLSRKVSRDLGVDFDLDTWTDDAETHGMSVQSLLATIENA
ncbi:acyl carrier protein [Amycolatopsis sp. cg5]|uniref:acyl carrier protein n=1 Tax=Amycolatopsis sp. cg5 TaxID=3238802 RepID=UPI003526A12A